MNSDPQADVYETVSGGDELLRWFGSVPSFHDAEILGLSLNRTGASYLVLRGCKVVVGADGFYRAEKCAVVTFVLEEVTDLELYGFNHQNVIDELRLSRIASEGFEIVLEDCWGLSGYFRARKLSVSLAPDNP